MSLIRPRWVDGQAITTPELQRVADTAAYSDDRVHEVFLTPGSVQKKIAPLLEENGSVNPQLIVVPSGTNGKVACQPCHFVAGDSGGATTGGPQSIVYSGTLKIKLDFPAITSNSSTSTRYDLVYATLNRTVPNTIAAPPANTAYVGTGLSDSSTATTTRKVKSVTDGSISTQSVSLYDSPTITLALNTGFTTTPPTAAQIAAALPSDTATSFSFALGYVTVAASYTAGTAIAQTAITQAYSRATISSHRSQGLRVPDWNGASPSEKPSNQLSSRFSVAHRLFIPFKKLSTTALSAGGGVIVDTSMDWRYRLLWGRCGYFGAGTNFPLESLATILVPVNMGTQPFQYWSTIGFTGAGGTSPILWTINYTATPNVAYLFVNASGQLCVAGDGTQANGSGDALLFVIEASGQIVTGM